MEKGIDEVVGEGPVVLGERVDARKSAGRRERGTWQPRWYMWDGGFLALGRSEGTVPPHSHHAIQVTVALDGVIGMTAGASAVEARGITPHRMSSTCWRCAGRSWRFCLSTPNRTKDAG